MADRGDTHYRVLTLNRWFAISSVLLLVATVWMMLDDWNRPWKKYQREFRQIEIARAEAELARLDDEGALETEALLAERVTEAEQVLASQKSELERAAAELRLASAARYNAVEAAKRAKSEFEWKRFNIENERVAERDPSIGVEELVEAERLMFDRQGEQQLAEAEEAEKQAAYDALFADKLQVEKDLASATRDLDRVRKKLEQLAPSDPLAKVANVIRDAPGTDFIGPNLKVQKQVLADLTFELNFTKKPRIDMCHTCHLAIDSDGYQEEEQPFTSHPRLDLYMTAKSPHPLKDVGCTICHRGSGEALDFTRADHRPTDEAEGEDWYEKYHWHKQHHWDYPMLPSGLVEASCVQCHKTSMELIAEDAPEVAQGYQTFERYGCYACHKVDWFPTKRRPGPALTNMQVKFSQAWAEGWIANPKAFRPTTWMPQFFHLENYAPEQVIAESEWGKGRNILGGEWNDAAVAAISAFLHDRAPLQPLPEIPVEGDSVRGAEVMRLVGCYACHNVAPHDGDPEVADLAQVARGTNEHGPNLRGVSTKVTPEWLFAWIKDPASYWGETRMPNLRLSDQDAADIVAYMVEDPDGVFTDTPAGWSAELVSLPEPQLREVLAEQARWFYARDGRTAINRRLSGEDPERRWDDTQRLKIDVGEKLVGHYGCFSCHEIQGMLDMQPIGTELSNWGSKTVDKLDFGFSYQKELANQLTGEKYAKLPHEYREPWLMRKLHAPRSFDTEKVKNPSERLRMPWFDFDPEQIDALTTFVVGLVDDEVQRAKMVPTPAQAAKDSGMRAVRQKNCMGCHMIDPGTITFHDEQGVQHTIAAELLPFGDDASPRSHDLAALREYMEEYEIDEEVGLRLLRTEPSVGQGFGSKVFVPADEIVSMTPPRGGDFVGLVTNYYQFGQELFDPEAPEDEQYYSVTADPEGEGRVEDVDGQWRNYQEEQYDKVRWTFAPPVLWNEGAKVQRDWFFGFLHDVVPLRHQVRVRMPTFSYEPGEAEAIVDYFAHKAAEEWPAHYARSLRLHLGLTPEDLAQQVGRVTPGQIRGIEDGVASDTAAGFDALLAWGREHGFELQTADAPQPADHVPGPVNPHYEALLTRSAGYLAHRAQELPGHLIQGQRIAVQAVNCFQCHFQLGTPPNADPVAWAPDLDLTRERLREEWTLEWLVDPQSIYPGTSMPGNFGGDPPQYQEVYPSSTNADQLRVVLEWLFNFDRVALEAAR